MDLAKNSIIIIKKKSIRTHGIKQKCNSFSVSSPVKHIPLLKTEALFKGSSERAEVLKMRMPDTEHHTLLNCFPGYCSKPLIEEPYSSNLVSGSYHFCSRALLTFWGVINN